MAKINGELFDLVARRLLDGVALVLNANASSRDGCCLIPRVRLTEENT